ncbi:hypothetical protein ZWY2020_055718 [Hordeum vulgare]|nr:hypothetical protein ZWY2020_055718 [Hordeum vulgare]
MLGGVPADGCSLVEAFFLILLPLLLQCLFRPLQRGRTHGGVPFGGVGVCAAGRSPAWCNRHHVFFSVGDEDDGAARKRRALCRHHRATSSGPGVYALARRRHADDIQPLTREGSGDKLHGTLPCAEESTARQRRATVNDHRTISERLADNAVKAKLGTSTGAGGRYRLSGIEYLSMPTLAGLQLCCSFLRQVLNQHCPQTRTLTGIHIIRNCDRHVETSCGTSVGASPQGTPIDLLIIRDLDQLSCWFTVYGGLGFPMGFSKQWKEGLRRGSSSEGIPVEDDDDSHDWRERTFKDATNEFLGTDQDSYPDLNIVCSDSNNDHIGDSDSMRQRDSNDEYTDASNEQATETSIEVDKTISTPWWLIPGFKFCPTDEHIVFHYLKPKVLNLAFRPDSRKLEELVNIYALDADDIKLDKNDADKERLGFFFVRKQGTAYSNGCYYTTPAGYWSVRGQPSRVKEGHRTVAFKTSMDFYRGRAPQGCKTQWSMFEYKLNADREDLRNLARPWMNSYVVCKVRKRECSRDAQGGEMAVAPAKSMAAGPGAGQGSKHPPTPPEPPICSPRRRPAPPAGRRPRSTPDPVAGELPKPSPLALPPPELRPYPERRPGEQPRRPASCASPLPATPCAVASRRQPPLPRASPASPSERRSRVLAERLRPVTPWI